MTVESAGAALGKTVLAHGQAAALLSSVALTEKVPALAHAWAAPPLFWALRPRSWAVQPPLKDLRAHSWARRPQAWGGAAH